MEVTLWDDGRACDPHFSIRLFNCATKYETIIMQVQ